MNDPISKKPYMCTECAHEKEIETNHYGECYPYCDVCEKTTVWVYTGEVPEGGWIPPKWHNFTPDDLLSKE